MIGVELVQDPVTKRPFPPAVPFGLRVGKRCLDHGLLLRFDPHWVAFGPALIVTAAEVDQMVDILALSVREVLREL
jgi:adenosylmethionine-8-amino-7-oxononanoate aminotransferase